MNSINTSKYPILEQNGFQIVPVDLTVFPRFEAGIFQAYKDVFNASAWREGVKCSAGCGYKTTFEEAPEKCPDCQNSIVDFYSNQEVAEAVQDVLSRAYAQCLLLLKGQEVAGFTWGWRNSLSLINSEKLGLSDEKFQKLQKTLGEYGLNPEDEFYYQSETGIIPKYRTRGIGNAIVGVNEQVLTANREKVAAIIQRTSRKSPMYTIRVNNGYTEVFSYEDTDERVIFAKNNK